MGPLGVPEMLIISFFGIIFILPSWKILTKAGFSGWLSFIIIIPIINFLFLIYFAFTKWPIQDKLDKYKSN